MEGYTTLRQRAERFLNDNPEVQMVTLKRPPPVQRRVYSNGNSECYGRMPESCPLVTEILRRFLPTDGSMQITRDGVEIGISGLRDEIFSEIHDQVTSKFRKALEEVCDQKHLLLSQMRGHQRELRDWLERAATDLPLEEPEPKPSRNHREVVEFEVEDEEYR